jgi:hypothetical protein
MSKVRRIASGLAPILFEKANPDRSSSLKTGTFKIAHKSGECLRRLRPKAFSWINRHDKTLVGRTDIY